MAFPDLLLPRSDRQIAAQLDMSANESTWTINAYVICLASFMLAAGKISDLWSAKYVFIGGL